jgi:hypothetical protein
MIFEFHAIKREVTPIRIKARTEQEAREVLGCIQDHTQIAGDPFYPEVELRLVRSEED